MSVLRPGEGLAINIGGIEFHFMFTFAALDELQTEFDLPMSDIIKYMGDRVKMYGAAGRIVHALIASDIYNNGGAENAPSYQDIMHVLEMKDIDRVVSTVLQAYGYDLPQKDENDEDDYDDDEEAEKINIARLLVIAKTELKMPESEFWRTTPRKFFQLYDEYVNWKTGGKEEDGGIDALP